MNANGTAQELPSLAGFEDDDPTDLASLLPARPRARAQRTAEPQPTPTPAEEPTAQEAGEPAPAAAPASPRRRATAAKGSAKGKASTKPRATKAPTTATTEAETKPPADAAPADEADAQNKTLPSIIHIPTDLIPAVIEYREASGMSNGQVLITAIEFSYEKLRDLIHPASTGGGLFQQRATKGSRSNDGPVSPLNIRLFKADFAVIDNVVKEAGAFSRGHLASVSFRYFFENQK